MSPFCSALVCGRQEGCYLLSIVGLRFGSQDLQPHRDHLWMLGGVTKLVRYQLPQALSLSDHERANARINTRN
jgi:hypothetical protein